MARKTLAKYIYDKLTEAAWPGIIYDEAKQIVSCPGGIILELKRGEYHLYFYWYSREERAYNLRDKYKELVFPKTFDIRNSLYFRSNGNYKLSNEQQFKNIVNPFKKSVIRVKLSEAGDKVKFYKEILVLPSKLFTNAINDAAFIYSKSSSYRTSTENYLSNIHSQKYSTKVRKRTTYIQKGEFKFLVDRFYIKTKRNKREFTRYINDDDIKSIENLLSEMFRLDVFSESFLRKLNEYFIKERLKEIIDLGRQILSLKTTNLNTIQARNVLNKMDASRTGQLETVWQKYFEKNLLYLIFTYKKIFPKVELKDIEGDKKYPDFIGVNHYNGLDVIEIKTHLKKALVWDNSHQNFYFSPEMSKAIVQTSNYMDAIMQERFKNPEDKQKITNFTEEENLYHPRGIIVISSQDFLTTKKGEKEKLNRDFTKLRNGLNNIEILTFDEVVNIADEYIKNIVPQI